MTPSELIQRLQLTAVKARSNAAEGGILEQGVLCDPFTYGDDELSLVGISTKMLDGAPTVMDAYNLLVLAEMKSPALSLVYYMRWEDELPEAMAYLRANL